MFGAPSRLGQQVVYGKVRTQYSQESDLAKPYPTEDELMATGQTQEIDSQYGSKYLGSWAHGTVSPPPIPYIDEEKDRLLAEQNRILWPRDTPFSLGQMDLGQDEPTGFWSNPPGWVMNWITPANAWGWVLSGGVLIALSQMNRLKYTIASPILAGGGGIILGIGAIPFIMKATAKKEKLG